MLLSGRAYFGFTFQQSSILKILDYILDLSANEYLGLHYAFGEIASETGKK